MSRVSSKEGGIMYCSEIIGHLSDIYRTLSAIIKYSKNNYNKVCLKFSEALQAAAGDRVDKVCNTIAGYAGGATGYQGGVAIGGGGGTETGDQSDW